MYGEFSEVYDALVYDVDYRKIASYLENLFNQYLVEKPEILVDLGCGTGTLTTEMAKKNYQLIGIDNSSEMLNIAFNKTREENRDVLFLNQDMREFELYGTTDVFYSILDSVNYILEYDDLCNMFKLVNNYLNPKGIFIFDVNSKYKLENIINNNTFFDIGEKNVYIWQNEFNKNDSIIKFDLTFFKQDKNNIYNRFDEIHYERIYSHEDIINIISVAGMEYINCFEAYTMNQANAKSQRRIYIARENGKKL